MERNRFKPKLRYKLTKRSVMSFHFSTRGVPKSREAKLELRTLTKRRINFICGVFQKLTSKTDETSWKVLGETY